MSSAPTTDPISEPAPSNWAYPNAFRSSLAYWWHNSSSSAPARAEAALLQLGLQPFHIGLKPPNATTPPSTNVDGQEAVLRNVQLPGKDSRRYLHSLEMPVPKGESKEDEADPMPIVVMHGYGGGLGFYFQQFAAMSGLKGTRTYFLDMLGMGLSGRPSFPCIKVGNRASQKDIEHRVHEAESFFVDALEQYREQQKIERMTLVGHSLGAYLSTAYSLRHPDRVHKLILISPVGVPESPYAKEGDADPEAVLAEEVGGDQAQDVRGKGKPKPHNTWWSKLWDANVSPFQVVRYSTVYGPNLVSRYAARRFAMFPNEVQRDLFQYLYQICQERGSGEYALAHILAPGAHARWPLVERIHDVRCPVTFIYGEHDWMDPKGAEASLEIFQRKPASPANDFQKSRSRMHINPYSGHWVFLDNPDGFNSIILNELREALTDWRTRGTR